MVVFFGIAALHVDDDEPHRRARDCEVGAADFARTDLSDALVIDVRTDAEYRDGHLKGAILINVRSRGFRERIEELDKTRRYYLYCKTGIRSAHAARIMQRSGFEHVCNVEGGIVDLLKQGVTLVR